MTLGWTLRVVCILTVSLGCTLAACQIVLALAARRILSRLDALSARRRERWLYLLQIGPALFAVAFAGAICLPAYIHSETNLKSESVSAVSVIVAGIFAAWFLLALLSGLRITVRTLRFSRGCRRSGEPLTSTSGIPVLAISDPAAPVRLVGFLRPLIVVSSSFSDAPSGAFEAALAHERSHARQHDNLKLLTLSFLPRLDRFLPGGNPWMKPWHQAADWAADDDAVHDDAGQALLLAEALVRAARAANAVSPRRYVCTALTSADAGLAARIDRLIHPRPCAGPTGSSMILSLTAAALLAGTAIWAMSPWIYTISEGLLHLGGS
jgi:beta-lactamase regulating signal transducer with metallopeptidase domain